MGAIAFVMLVVWGLAVLAIAAFQITVLSIPLLSLGFAVVAVGAACSLLRSHATTSPLGPVMLLPACTMPVVIDRLPPFVLVGLFVLGTAIAAVVLSQRALLGLLFVGQAALIATVSVWVLYATHEVLGWFIALAILAADGAAIGAHLLVDAVRQYLSRPSWWGEAFGKVRWGRIALWLPASAAVGTLLYFVRLRGVPGVLEPQATATRAILLVVFALLLCIVYLIGIVGEARDRLRLTVDASARLRDAQGERADSLLLSYGRAMVGTTSLRIQDEPPGYFEVGVRMRGEHAGQYLVSDQRDRTRLGPHSQDREILASLVALIANARAGADGEAADAAGAPAEASGSRRAARPPRELLCAALHRGDFEAWFQPIVDVHGRHIVATEAVARTTDPALARFSPPQLVAAARAAGALDRLTEIVLASALEGAARFLSREPSIGTVHVNLLAEQLRSPAVHGLLASAARSRRPLRLCIELAETSDPAALLEVADGIAELRAHGVHFAYDDFGSMASSVAALAALEFDVVKLDREFAVNLHRPGYQRVLRAMTSDASSYARGALVLEGVETREMEATGRALGIRLMQGFLYGAPQPADALYERLLSRGSAA